MRYTSRQYAQALYELISEKTNPEHAIDQYVSFLQKQNQLSNWSRIYRAFEKIYQRKNNMRSVIITTAQPLDRTDQTHYRTKFKAEDIITFETSPDIIGGAIITINKELQLDASFRSRIKKILSS